MREHISTRPILQEMVKEVLQTKRKDNEYAKTFGGIKLAGRSKIDNFKCFNVVKMIHKTEAG
jgi:hypothetical protein